MNYFESWHANLSDYLKGYLYNEEGDAKPVRFVFDKLKSYLLDFAVGKFGEKIILLPGMRGVGKTTLLAQLYFFEKYLKSDEHEIAQNIKNRIYITADDLAYNNLSLKDFVGYYEKKINSSLSVLKDKTLIFIDEIHYDPKWGMFLKRLYDEAKGHKNLLVFATGSSALLLKTNTDLTRRKIEEKIYPLSFSEYLYLKKKENGKSSAISSTVLGNKIKESIFFSKTAENVFEKLSNLSSEVMDYYSNVSDFKIEIEKYLKIGSFPFSIETENEIITFEKIGSILSKVIEEDILKLKKFDSNTILKLHNLLYLIASSYNINLSKVSGTLLLNIQTLRQVLDAFVESEILLKIPSFGTAYSQARKELKYLFLSSAMRNSILKGLVPSGTSGAMLEDESAHIFYRELLKNNQAQMFYDSSQGGADFVLKFIDGRKIIIEIGKNKESVNQVIFSSKKIKPDYGIVVGSEKLDLIDRFIVKIPIY